MDAPNNPTFWRPRADLIRECVAAGLSPKETRERCAAEGYNVHDKSFRQAAYSARKSAGYKIPERPSYYMLWVEFMRSYDGAVRSGKPIVVTQEMKNIIDVAEHCIIHDKVREPVKRKRKVKRK